MIVITLRKLSVLPHIIILDSVTSTVPTSMVEAIYSEVQFEREQLASSTGEDISDQVYIINCVSLLVPSTPPPITLLKLILIGVGDIIVRVSTQGTY